MFGTEVQFDPWAESSTRLTNRPTITVIKSELAGGNYLEIVTLFDTRAVICFSLSS